MVGLLRQEPADNLLRDPAVCGPINPAGEGVRLENRYLVTGRDDVRDAGGREPLQNNKIGRTDQDCQGRDQDPVVRRPVRGGLRFLVLVPAEEPRASALHPRTPQPRIFQEIPREERQEDVLSVCPESVTFL